MSTLVEQPFEANTPSGLRVKGKMRTSIVISDPVPPLETTWGKLRGVNWISGVLNGNLPSGIATADIKKFMAILHNLGCNFIRIVGYWDSYEKDKKAYTDELKAIIGAADDLGIVAFYDNHQWHFGGSFAPDSKGIPARYYSGYHGVNLAGDYDGSPNSRVLWADFWSNTLKNGLNPWLDMKIYWAEIIDAIDSFDNLLGYEILNEPRTTAIGDYAKLGAFNSAIGAFINDNSTKKVFFCRDNGIAGYNANNAERPRMIPAGASNLVYDAHMYRVSAIDQIVNQTKAVVASRPDIPVVIGETATDPKYGTAITKENAKVILNRCKAEGFSMNYWAFGCWSCGLGKKLVGKDGALQPEANTFRDAIKEVYA